MRTILLATAVLGAGIASLTTSRMPLPWRGALTRHAWAEVLRGRLPVMRCERQWITLQLPGLTPPSVVHRASTDAVTCSRLARDSSSGAVANVYEGRVDVLRRMWWRPADAGAALADSLARELTAAHGASIACATTGALEWQGRLQRELFWRSDVPGMAIRLRVWADVPWSREGPVGWVVSVHEFRGAPRCHPA